MEEEVINEYQSSLNDLTFNSKPLINMLTMLAEDNEQHASHIVDVIESHIAKAPSQHKLPALYLIDSIIKNLPKSTYLSLFTHNIVSTFCGMFEKVDEKARQSMFKVRQTWNDLFPNRKLYAIDVRVNLVDPAWPITAQAPAEGSIHVNPKFLAAKKEEEEEEAPIIMDTEEQEAQMRQQLIAKQQELLRLQQQRLELELKETKAKLEQQKQINAGVTLNLEPLVSESPPSPETSSPASFPSAALPPASVQASTVTTRPMPRDPRLTSRDPRLQGRGPSSVNMVPTPQEESELFPGPASTTLPPFTSPPVMIDVVQRPPLMMQPGLPPHPHLMPPPHMTGPPMYPPPPGGGMLLRPGPPSHTSLVPSGPPPQIGMIPLPTTAGSRPMFPGTMLPFPMPTSQQSAEMDQHAINQNNQALAVPDHEQNVETKLEKKDQKSSSKVDKPKNNAKSNTDFKHNDKHDSSRRHSDSRRDTSKDKKERDSKDYKSSSPSNSGAGRRSSPRQSRSSTSSSNSRDDKSRRGGDDDFRRKKRGSRDSDEDNRSKSGRGESTEKKRDSKTRSSKNQKSDSKSSSKSSHDKSPSRRSRSPIIKSRSPDSKSRSDKNKDKVKSTSKSSKTDDKNKTSKGKDDQKTVTIKKEPVDSDVPEKAKASENNEPVPMDTDERSKVPPRKDIKLMKIPKIKKEAVDKDVHGQETSLAEKDTDQRIKPSTDSLKRELKDTSLESTSDSEGSSNSKKIRLEDKADSALDDEKKTQAVDDDLSSLFGTEDTDYRSVPSSSVAHKSPHHARWAKFRSQHPDDFRYELDHEKERENTRPESPIPQDTDLRSSFDKSYESEPAMDSDLRQLSSTPRKVDIPNALTMDHREEIMVQIQKRRLSGELSFEQERELLVQLSKLDQVQRQQQKLRQQDHTLIPGQSLEKHDQGRIERENKEPKGEDRLDKNYSKESRFRRDSPLKDIHGPVRRNYGGRQISPVKDYDGRNSSPRDYDGRHGDGPPDMDRNVPLHDRDLPRIPQDMPHHERHREDDRDWRGRRPGYDRHHEYNAPNSREGWRAESDSHPRNAGSHRGNDRYSHRLDDDPYRNERRSPYRDDGPHGHIQGGPSHPEDGRYNNSGPPHRDIPSLLDGPIMDRPSGLRNFDANGPPNNRRREMINSMQKDPRWRYSQGFGMLRPEENEEFVIDGKPYCIQLGQPARKIRFGFQFIEVFADPNERAIRLDGKIVYRFGDFVKDIQFLRGKHKVFYHGLPRLIWIDGLLQELRVDAPPKIIIVKDKELTIRIDGRDNMIIIDNKEFGQYGGPPRYVFINNNRCELRFDPPPRKILIDKKMCELKLDRAIPCVIVDNKPRGIRFDGPPRHIFVNDTPYLVPMDEPVKIKISNRPHYLAFGGPAHEVILDGKWFEVKFGGTKKEISLGNRVIEVKLDGPPPDVKILDEIIEEELSIGPSMGPPHNMNGPRPRGPVPGPRGPMQGPRDPVPGPRGPMQGPRQSVQGPMPGPREPVPGPRGPMPGPREPVPGPRGPMPGPREPVPGPRGPMPGPRVQLDGPHGPPGPGQFQPRMMHNEEVSGGMGTGPMGPRGPGMMERPLGPPQQVMQQGPMVPGQGMVRPGLPNVMPNDVRQQHMMTGDPIQPQFGGQMPQQNQMMPGMAGQDGMMSQQQGGVQMMPNPMANLFGPNPVNSQPQPQHSQPQLQQQPNMQLDINSLLQRLQAAGIIKKSEEEKATENKTEPTENDVTKPEDKKDKFEKMFIKPVKIKPIPNLTSLKTDILKKPHEGVIQKIYSGIQCSSCGQRFTAQQTDTYREHLDWHFRQNRKDKDDAKVTKYRRWFYNLGDWLEYEEIDESEEKGRSAVFDQMLTTTVPQGSVKPELTFAVPEGNDIIHRPVATGDENGDICEICKDPFEQYWDEEEEEWHLRDAIRVDNKTYHPVCYEDEKEGSILEPTPTPVKVPPVNPLVLQIQQELGLSSSHIHIDPSSVKEITEATTLDLPDDDEGQSTPTFDEKDSNDAANIKTEPGDSGTHIVKTNTSALSS